MAEGLKIKIGADIVEVTQSLNDVERDIKQLSKEIKNLSGQALVDANKQLEVLNQRAQGLKNIGRGGFDQFGTAIQGLGRSASGAVPALNSIGQVARDLPFGFIAIQNNLPIVIDQFTALSRGSGGAGAALRALGGALIGPAGIAFAFGAVTAGVTALIQKYGSLSNAFDAITGKSREFTKEQQKIIDGVADELASVTLLVGLYPQLAGRREEQDKLLKKLNQSAPTYFKTLSSEQTTVDNLTKSYDRYVKSFLGKIFIESQQERLTEIAKQYAKELINVNDAQVQGAQQRNKDANRLKNQIALNDRLANSQLNLRGDIGVGIRFAPVQNTFDDAINTLLNNFKAQADKILSGTEVIVSKLDFGSVFEDKTIGDNAKKSGKDAAIKFAQELEQTLANLKQSALAEALDFSDVKPIEISIQGKPKPLTQDELTAALGLDRSVSPGLDQALIDFNNFRTALDETKKSSQQAGPVISSLFQIFSQNNRDFTKSAVDNFNKFKDQVANVTKQFNDFLAPAIDTVFGALQNGTSIPKALGQAFKALITQLAITVVKAAALAAILSLIPAAGPLLGVAGGASGGFGKIFGSLLGVSGRQTAAPTFGNLQPGGLQLAGGVALTLRGTDLVGAISGANARINRVG